MANCKENEKRAHKTRKTHCIGEKVEITTILASSFLSDHSNIIIHVQKCLRYDIHNQLMASVNPEISCFGWGSGPALFGLARFYCIANCLLRKDNAHRVGVTLVHSIALFLGHQCDHG